MDSGSQSAVFPKKTKGKKRLIAYKELGKWGDSCGLMLIALMFVKQAFCFVQSILFLLAQSTESFIVDFVQNSIDLGLQVLLI